MPLGKHLLMVTKILPSHWRNAVPLPPHVWRHFRLYIAFTPKFSSHSAPRGWGACIRTCRVYSGIGFSLIISKCLVKGWNPLLVACRGNVSMILWSCHSCLGRLELALDPVVPVLVGRLIWSEAAPPFNLTVIKWTMRRLEQQAFCSGWQLPTPGCLTRPF